MCEQKPVEISVVRREASPRPLGWLPTRKAVQEGSQRSVACTRKQNLGESRWLWNPIESHIAPFRLDSKVAAWVLSWRTKQPCSQVQRLRMVEEEGIFDGVFATPAQQFLEMKCTKPRNLHKAKKTCHRLSGFPFFWLWHWMPKCCELHLGISFGNKTNWRLVLFHRRFFLQHHQVRFEMHRTSLVESECEAGNQVENFSVVGDQSDWLHINFAHISPETQHKQAITNHSRLCLPLVPLFSLCGFNYICHSRILLTWNLVSWCVVGNNCSSCCKCVRLTAKLTQAHRKTFAAFTFKARTSISSTMVPFLCYVFGTWNCGSLLGLQAFDGFASEFRQASSGYKIVNVRERTRMKYR